MNATMKTDYEEFRIDCARQSAEELALAREQAQLLFRLNQTMPMTEEYDQLMHRLFPRMGEGSVVTHDVEPNTIVAGNPARLIRRLSDEEIAGAAALAGRTE